MYTLPKNTKINNKVLNAVIEYNEKYKTKFDRLEDYYICKNYII